jgi:hypothetical protein
VGVNVGNDFSDRDCRWEGSGLPVAFFYRPPTVDLTDTINYDYPDLLDFPPITSGAEKGIQGAGAQFTVI